MDCRVCGLDVDPENDCVMVHDSCVDELTLTAIEHWQLRAKVAELEAQLARTWQPVEDGFVFRGRNLNGDIRTIVAREGGGYLLVSDPVSTIGSIGTVLPPTLRLCRQTYG